MWRLYGSEIGQQALEFPSHHVVALAYACFQSAAIQYFYMPATIANQPRILQFQRRFCDAGASHAKHISDQFLCHLKFVRR
jgi:hypothetical protein